VKVWENYRTIYFFPSGKDNGAGKNACNNIKDNDETYLRENQKATTALWPIADSTTGTGAIKGGADYCIGISWNVPISASNIIQTDSLVGDVIFNAVQSRNMPNFKCSDLYKEVCGDGKDNDYDGQVDEGCIIDSDGDQVGDNMDNCVNTPNPDQMNTDNDLMGNACDPDDDNDGVIDAQDPNNANPNICGDTDGDLCDDCSSGTYNPSADGTDTDGDGTCNTGDTDDDNDGVLDASDVADLNPQVCQDVENDTCDDCSQNPTSTSSQLPWPVYFPSTANDGIDIDGDGICDQGDIDDDNDADPDTTDCNDADAKINNGATEICNGVDDNCDGVVDEGCKPWINEIHYENIGTDANEGVELAGKAGVNLAGWKIIPYNGSGGASYTPILDLSGIIPNQQNGSGTLWFALVGMQNGAPDGLALVSPSDTVIQFLSYEGSFMATNGPASGMMSTDIGVREDVPIPPVDYSLQLQGIGNEYGNFIWSSPIVHTRGAVNTGQTFN
jgi:hypothetical protein